MISKEALQQLDEFFKKLVARIEERGYTKTIRVEMDVPLVKALAELIANQLEEK